MDIQVSITGSAPPPNEYRDITATAQYGNYTYKTHAELFVAIAINSLIIRIVLAPDGVR